MSGKIDRRSFLKGLALGGAGLALGKEALSFQALVPIEDPLKQYPYRSWEDLYKNQWTWDKVSPSTHSANCTGSCRWMVYVKNGVVMREEQASDFGQINPDIPTFNPRGCQKGACYSSDYLYGPNRLRYPMMRTGERGQGKWKRLSWKEALETIAEKMVDTIKEHGPDTINYFTPIPAMSYVRWSSGNRLANLTGGVSLTFYDWYCDLLPAEPITFGVQGDVAETADFYNSRYVLIWASRVTDTRIPDAHFVTEARYNGTKLVGIFSDYCPTAIKVDQHVPIKPGTDGAMALAMCQVVINDNLYDESYIKEQTDLPFLIRLDNNKFLREKDMKEDGKDGILYAWDRIKNAPVAMPGTWDDPPENGLPAPLFLGRNTLGYKQGTLDLKSKGIDPLLEGRFKVKLADGREVEVATVFTLIKEGLSKYTPEWAQGVTGISAKVISQIAREFAETAKRTGGKSRIILGMGVNHWFNNDTIIRPMILFVALTGTEGKDGGGITYYVGQWKPVAVGGLARLAFPLGANNQRFQNTTMWSYVHSEINDAIDDEERRRQGIKRPIRDYIKESAANGWIPLYPKQGKEPKVFFIWNGNWTNQAKGGDYVLRNMFPKLDLIVNLNIRLDTSALYADIVLPVAGHYEKDDLNSTEEHTFMHVLTPAIEPLYECKSEWQIFKELAKKVEEVAERKGLTRFYDEQFGIWRDLSNLTDQYTQGGRLSSEKDAAQFILDNGQLPGISSPTEGMTFDGLVKKAERFKNNWTSPMEDGVPYSPFKRFVAEKRPWPTFTGRMQFYIDHDWFIEMGENLLTYKPSLEADKYPLRYTTPHNRWFIHSTWSEHQTIMRLMRGGQIIYMNPDDMADRGIKDNDWVKIYNGHGHFVCRVKVYPSSPRGFITNYFGHEKFSDVREGFGYQSPVPIRIKPTQLVKYYHLTFKPNYWGPTGSQRDVKVEVEKYTKAYPI